MKTGPGLALALWLVLPPAVQAQERILAFHSDIEVQADAGMTVTETIRVRAEGKQIKRGIYRDFPTSYRDRLGNHYRVGFEVLAVTRDGELEAFHYERRRNGVRVYIGRKERYLSPGIYTYTLRYRTNRQLGFFAEHDELYWNVTGNDWAFAIERASAAVRLPGIAPSLLRLHAYTGPAGARGKDYVARTDPAGGAYFESTRVLPPRQGLTIVVEWPKGYVSAPTLAGQLRWLLRDNRELAVLALGMGTLLAYYWLAWLRVGRDPPPGVMVPQYVPPKAYSPASMRFIRRMGYDQRTFAAALVNLAVKGYLRITEDEGDFTVERAERNDVRLAPGEQALVKKLFSALRVVPLQQQNHGVIGGALKAHKNALRRNYEKIYFLANSGYLAPGVLISLAAFVAAIFAAPTLEPLPALFLTVWLSVWSVACMALVAAAASAWRTVASGGVGKALQTTAFAIPFLGFEGFGLWAFSQVATISIGIGVILLALLNLLFYQLLKAPTLAGRKLLDQIEGFRHYLQVAEGPELRGRRPRETLDLFEIYLPYALALEVENEWSERFAAKIAQAETEERRGFSPSWYRSSHGYTSIPRMTSALGSSLGGAIAASAQAPGSSSGGGGGGSSGGGGGGGGGGGW